MTKDELFKNWLNSLDIPLVAWQKEVLRLACTNPGKTLYISLPRHQGRHLVMKLVEQYKQMIEGEKEKEMSKNLTKKHRFPDGRYKEGEWETVGLGTGFWRSVDPSDGQTYYGGPLVDRLHEFEKLGYEPEELKKIIAKHEQMEKFRDEVAKNFGLPRSILFPEESPSAHSAKLGEIAREAFDDALKSAFLEKKFNVPKGVPGIKRVLFNNPATIVFWADGDKTVVKCQNGEPYDPEKGLAMAISKKALGNDRGYFHVFQKFCKNKPSEVARMEDLEAAHEDIRDTRALATDALDWLKKSFDNKKATKEELSNAMWRAIECLNVALGVEKY